jgi:hypothetical protein
LATHVDEVSWQNNQTDKGGRVIRLQPKESKENINIIINGKGEVTSSKQADWKGKKLDEVLGKGLADKIMEKETGTLSGDGLSFGGEWAKNLYDRQVRDIVKKLTGAEVKTVDMGLGTGGKASQQFTYASGNDAGGIVRSGNLKKGMEITDEQGTLYKVSDVLGNGKFKAINDSNGFTKEFDLSAKTSNQTQQYIDLTPEVKAKIQSKAPSFKMKNPSAGESLPLIFLLLGGGAVATQS